MTSSRLTFLAFTLIGLTACGSTQVEQEYGNSVRLMIQAQTFDPRTLTNPSTAPVIGADPDMVNTAVEVFRENVSRPEEVGKPITIQLGSGR
jgi:hypothetical protein